MSWTRDDIAARASRELKDGDYVDRILVGTGYVKPIEQRTVRAEAV